MSPSKFSLLCGWFTNIFVRQARWLVQSTKCYNCDAKLHWQHSLMDGTQKTLLARNVDTAGPVFKPPVTPCRRPFNCPPARAASIQPPRQWLLKSSIAQQASYSFNWCWWPSVPSFRSEQVSSTRPLPCCSHRSPILWYQKIHWIPITQLILPRQTYWVLQGTFRLGWSLTCSLPVSRAGLGWRRHKQLNLWCDSRSSNV